MSEPPDPSTHILPPDRLEEIFRRRIMPDVRAQVASPAAKPGLVILAGQPGSGKSVLRPSLERFFDHHGGAVGVSGDDFRPMHPHYEALLTGGDDLLMAQATRQAAAWWTDRVINWSMGERYNVVWEDTLWNTERTLTTMQAAKDHDYRTTLVVLAVPIVQSRLGIVGRYVGQRELVGAGRWTSGDAHDPAPYERLAESLAAIEQTSTVDRVVVASRDEVIYDNDRPAAGSWIGGSPSEHLAAARERALPAHEQASLQRRLDDLIERIARLGIERNPPIERLIAAVNDDLVSLARRTRTRSIPPSDALER